MFALSQAKQTKEQLILIVIYLGVLFLAIITPVFAVLAVMALPILFTVIFSRQEIKISIFIILIGITFSLLFDTVISLPVILCLITVGGFIGHAIRTKHTAYETWVKATMGYTVGFVLVMLYDYVVFEANIFDVMDSSFKWFLNEVDIGYTQMGFDAVWEKQGLNYDQFINQAGEMLQALKDLVPALLIIISMALGICTQWLSYKIINQMEAEKRLFPKFKSFALPKYVLWIYLFVLLAQILGVSADSVLNLVVVNIYTIIIVLVVIQGLSFIVFFVAFKKFHPVFQVLIITFFVLSLLLTGIFVLLLGIIDLGFSLKKRMAMNEYKDKK